MLSLGRESSSGLVFEALVTEKQKDLQAALQENNYLAHRTKNELGIDFLRGNLPKTHPLVAVKEFLLKQDRLNPPDKFDTVFDQFHTLTSREAALMSLFLVNLNALGYDRIL